MKNLKVKNWKFISIKEFNQKINNIKKYSNVVILKHELKDYDCFGYFYVIVKKSKIFLIYYDALKNCKRYFWTFLDKNTGLLEIKGSQAYRIFKLNCKFNFKLDPKIFEVEEISELGTSSAFIYFNDNFNFTKQKAWEYDLNSAYSFSAIGKIPTYFLRKNSTLKNENEIGFNIDDEGVITFNFSKTFKSDYIFKYEEMPSFNNFFLKYYKKKKNAPNKKLKNYYKEILNYTVGYFQLINPFLRAFIINKCNNYIMSFFEKHQKIILLSNTDSLITLEPIQDLKIGEEIGQFKIVRKNEDFYLYNNNYQWKNEPPTYRSIPKAWFDEYKKRTKKDFDLSKTSVKLLSNLFNKYYFDLKDLKIKEVKIND